MNSEATYGAAPLASPQEQVRSRIAASLLFLLNGIGFGTWAALIPSIKHKFELTESSLGLVLLTLAIGAMLSMSLIGRVLARYGSRTVLRFLAPAYCVALAFIPLSPSLGLLFAIGLIFGAFKGSLDVSCNSQAITIQSRRSTPIMSNLQALWSLGGLVAASTVGIALKQGAEPVTITLPVSVVLLATALYCTRRLAGGDASTSKPSGGFKLPDQRLLKIGVLAFLVLFAEGVMMDWSAVYARSVSGAADWLAPFAFGTFSLSMATGRLLGDWAVARHGGLNVLRVSGVLLLVGLLLVVSVKVWPVTFIGLGFAGLGLANLVPVLLSAAGRAHRESVAQGVATASVIGYFGFLVGPPAIGGLSHWVGLPGSFVLVLVFALLLVLPGPSILRSASREA
ncbi:MFS transporter [Haloferula sp. BvORR071]|uniref:MFS transporter n=1 Tax=Haloferula sp. BvORR071 TaxID=1396141 RepID=UPI002240FB8D|nr:MFS transporter [Haloferula sp. BvORR071]